MLTMRRAFLSILTCLLASGTVWAQLVDATQAPNPENAGIQKSLAEQIGAGQGDALTVDSSTYIIRRDPFRSIKRGRQLFQRKFTVQQGLGPITGDGHGDVAGDGSIGAGLMDSCAGCHGRPHGAAGFGGVVATRPDSRDAPHLFGLGLQEMLADEITADLRVTRDAAIAEAIERERDVTEALESKGIEYGELTAHADGTVDASRVVGVNADLRVRPFFAQGGTVSIREFVVGALNAEMGLETFDPVLAAAAAGGRVETAAGMVLDGSLDQIDAPPVSGPAADSDADGVVDEIDPALIDHLEFYLLNYFKPGSYLTPDARAPRLARLSRDVRRFDDDDDDDDESDDDDDDSDDREPWGLRHMDDMGCLNCHVQDLQVDRDRRVADVETVYNPLNGGAFNGLFATATPLFEEVPGSGEPAIKRPLGGSFEVRNIFADFKRHDLGPAFWERNYDGSMQKEFMTEPLWGVGTTPPYGHDGRSINLREVVLRHGGEALESRDEFAQASRAEQEELLGFLRALVLFPPVDTPSNLNPGDPTHPDYPQRGHGSIELGALFNDPTDPE